MTTITLTIAEIKDLAQFAGLILTPECLSDTEEDNTEIRIEPCPKEGLMHENDEPNRRHYNKIAFFEDYPDEGVMGLGPEIKK